MNIAQIIKGRRLELNISQETLAKHIGFQHRSNVSLLEAEKLEWKWKDVMSACDLLKLEIEIVKKG